MGKSVLWAAAAMAAVGGFLAARRLGGPIRLTRVGPRPTQRATSVEPPHVARAVAPRVG
jgi:hypothetical protein